MASSNGAQSKPPADIHQYSGQSLLAVSTIFVILDTLFTLGRIVSRRMVKKQPIGLDDVLLIPSYLSCLGMCIIGYAAVYIANVGYHVEAATYLNPATMVLWAKTIYALNPIYYTAAGCPKLAILALYKRIFTDRWTRLFTWILIVLVTATWVGLMVAAFMQCVPVAVVWNKNLPGKCYNVDLFYKLGNLPIIVTDIPMIILPFPALWKLQASTGKKLGLSLIFIISAMGIIGSVVRFILFEEHNAFIDPTWASVQLVGWSIIEPSMYLIAFCLLSLRPLLARISSSCSAVRSLVAYWFTGKDSHQPDSSIMLTTNSNRPIRARGFETLAGCATSEEFQIEETQANQVIKKQTDITVEENRPAENSVV